jgi:hypothetical protein
LSAQVLLGRLVPPSFANAGSHPRLIHTFGFGANHDPAAMHAITEATGGR